MMKTMKRTTYKTNYFTCMQTGALIKNDDERLEVIWQQTSGTGKSIKGVEEE